MKERPMLFSAAMVRALLAGTKTQTRRVMKTQPNAVEIYQYASGPQAGEDYQVLRYYGDHPKWSKCASGWTLDCPGPFACPYGKLGDRLWAITIVPVAGYEDRYGVGDDGNAYRIDRPEPRKMRPGTTSKGYLCVTLCRDGKRTTANLHNLVCTAFYGEKPEWAHEVRHLDGDRTNNAPENLDWGTRSQNWSDKRALGRSVRSNHHAAKLSENQRAQIIAWSGEGNSQRRIAARLGVSQSTVSAFLTGDTWKKSPPADPPNMPRWASRITLEITGVRVERLQGISDSDANAEGVEIDGGYFKDYTRNEFRLSTARGSFHSLWQSINGPDSWDANPWVWVVEFKRVAEAARQGAV